MKGAPELGTEIAGYRLESVLGEGGMGTVYLARGPEGGICALKVLSAQLSEDPSFTTRFKREARYAEALDHPHIVELYDAGETPDGILYFAMQYVDGPDLGVLLRRDGRFTLPMALLILGQIGDALDCAHATGLVHRDVKPGNIIVADDPGGPQAYLADFGLSKNRSQDSVALTKMGQLLGTMSYAAPEEIMATEPRDHRVDIYSLGCVLYESIVGAPPFVGDQQIGVLYAHIGNPRPSATAARPDLPTGIDDVIAKAMAISAEERYSSCAELIAAARSLLMPVEARSPEAEAMGAAPAVPAAVAVAAAAATPVSAQPGAEEDSAPPNVLTLVVLSGFGHGLTLTVEDELVLGRQMTLEGALEPDHSISRRHARITRTGDGAFTVEDEHSRNGTFVNGGRIDAPQTLRTGDELRIGATAFEVTVPDPEVPDPEVPDPEVPEPEAERATDEPSEWIEAPHGENAADASAEWIDATPAENAADAPADWVESPEDAPAESIEPAPAENAADAPADWVESPEDAPVESVEPVPAENAPDAEWVEAAQAESAAEAPAESLEAPQELVVEARKPGARLALRLELDVEAGELIVAIENGATVRLVRHGDEWYVESD